MNIIYVDVLIVLNLIVNYFLLLSTARLSGRRTARLRFFLGSLFGALCSLLIFVPLNFFVSLLVKLLITACMTFISFPYRGAVTFLKTLGFLFFISIVYAAVMLVFCSLFAPTLIYVSSGMVYLDINILMLVGFTVCSYILIGVYERIRGAGVKSAASPIVYRMKISSKGSFAFVSAFVDTGNNLKDFFSGYPVIVCEYNSVLSILPEEIIDYYEHGGNVDKVKTAGLRLIPYSTISSSGLIPIFMPDYIQLSHRGGDKYAENVYIGVCRGALTGKGYTALLGPDIKYQTRTLINTSHKKGE